MTTEERLEDLAHKADLIGRSPTADEVYAVLSEASAPESEIVAEARAKLIAECGGGKYPPGHHRSAAEAFARPIPAAQARAAALGQAMAPKMGDIRPNVPSEPASTGFEGGAELRPVQAINVAGLEPNTPATTGPIFEWVDPATLLVNEAYQRDLSERSTKLIRRIIAGWDWAKFTPPVCSLGDYGLEVIDGQHTSIAAASHPRIAQIPVMIVETADVAARAMAFIGQNVDRVGITKMQLHRAAVAAGDEDALTIEQVCERAGVRLLMAKPHTWATGETVAIGAIGGLIDRRHAHGARRVLEVLVAADEAPVTQNGIKAVEMIMFEPDYAEADTDHLAEAILALGDTAEADASTYALSHRLPLWKALGIVWFRKCRKKRKAA